ncbi:Endonuclease/exonuclease/phosphatase like protein [Babesia gibsoni]|uniref:Endonuclease/exonuclease/phosphatase like protein n=1 Tax=Babesia gibsoni TaxID=33632 RepID=A0AAD8LLW2_BABGI|nr:Endonuclease/exonuclease/phosphatase like protein [Babesia gibsoni]
MSSVVPVTVMSYNIQGLSNVAYPIANLAVRMQSIISFLVTIVEKYAVDVLILQEVFTIGLYQGLKLALSSIMSYDTGIRIKATNAIDTWQHLLSICVPSLKLTPGGVIIFSKHEIREKKRFLYNTSILPDLVASKGVVLARIMINGRLLDVLGTHVQSHEGKAAEKVRTQQMTEVADWIGNKRGDYVLSESERIPAKDIPVVLAGDFNSCVIRDAEATQTLFRALENVCKPIFGDKEPEATYSTITNDFCRHQNKDEYDHVYDYILVGPNVEVQLPQTVVRDVLEEGIFVYKRFLRFFRNGTQEVRNVSDHYPVYATIGI